MISGDTLALRIRVGSGASDVGQRKGFEQNAVCNDIFPGVTLGSPVKIYCHVPLIGRILSIMSVETVALNQLRLCDVQIF